EVVSRPYIDMTLALMRRYGAQATFAGHTIEVAGGAYEPQELTVEADWSAASYWYALAALLPGSEITLPGLERDSLQGDSAVRHMMSPLGVTTEWLPAGGVRLSGRPTCNCPAHLDMTATPDLAQTLAVTLCLLGRPFRLTGLRSLRIKETDRLEGLRSQLAKVGYLLTVEGDEALSWDGDRCEPQPNPVIDTLHDHRMAMAMALCAVKHPGVVIDDAQVVTKSYPAFWQQLGQAGFTIVQLS
ncbi:MAG: 3-phosphoshikimate 1-carboxyvinyltransferase, partial [Muribaculaceae bacterium]|nr:3-phosphoshikimate 1-carboxyvinyltransferase [Muribaculaceae bacterium]